MRKKALVITLALVLAFASSAMAAVSFSGKFNLDFARNFDFTDNNNLFDGTYTLTPTLNFSISASSKGESEDRVDWEFSSGVKFKKVEGQDEEGQDEYNWTLSGYKLGLYDQYFKAWVWGDGAELSDKATQFGWISASKAGGEFRSRVEVPVTDVATVTADFEGTTMRLFVDGAVEGYNVGAAYELAKWDEANRTNRVVVQADGSIPAGDLDIALKAAVGIDVKKEDSGFAFGVDATVNPTDALSLNVVVKNNDKWAAKGQTDVTAAATYTEAAFQLKGEVSQSFVKDGDNKPGITLTGFYRMSDTLNYGDLFNKDKWYTNDAPAFGVKAELSGANFSKLTIDATAPVVADVASVKAKAEYQGKSAYSADVLGRIVATSKLTLSPQVKFTKTAADDTLELKLGASYRIGDTGPSVTF